tara:strand:- start:170 stop:433 length:264 start_codon:yes stop_codon:yes gene_type:complete
MTFPEKYEIPIDKYPKNSEYKMGGPSMYVVKGGLGFRDTPLSQFKRESIFRLYGETILKDHNYDIEKYTLIYHTEPEWSNYFTLSKR